MRPEGGESKEKKAADGSRLGATPEPVQRTALVLPRNPGHPTGLTNRGGIIPANVDRYLTSGGLAWLRQPIAPRTGSLVVRLSL